MMSTAVTTEVTLEAFGRLSRSFDPAPAERLPGGPGPSARVGVTGVDADGEGRPWPDRGSPPPATRFPRPTPRHS